jgi:gamma-glutamyltranspeptidase
MVRPQLADTLDIIARNASEFYNGMLARDVLSDLKETGLFALHDIIFFFNYR